VKPIVAGRESLVSPQRHRGRRDKNLLVVFFIGDSGECFLSCSNEGKEFRNGEGINILYKLKFSQSREDPTRPIRPVARRSSVKLPKSALSSNG
jgi:hypothetical protein